MKQQNLIVELKQRNALVPNMGNGSDTQIQQLLQSIADKEKQLAELQTRIGSKDVDINRLTKEIADLKKEILTRVAKDQYDKLQARYDKDIRIKEEIDELQTALNQKIETKVTDLTSTVSSLQQTIERNSLVVQLNQQLAEAQQTIQTLNTQKTDLHTENTQIKLQNQNLNGRVQLLERQLDEQREGAHRGFLVDQYQNTTIDEFYAMYSQSAAMRETGIFVTPFEFNTIMGLFLKKLPFKEKVLFSVIPESVTATQVVTGLPYTSYGTQQNDGKIEFSYAKYSGKDEFELNTYYPNLSISFPLRTENVHEYLKSIGINTNLNLRIPIVQYGLKYIAAYFLAGDWKTHTIKKAYFYWFELSDGSITAKRPVVIKTNEDLGALSWVFDKVPENAVALVLRMELQYSSNTNPNNSLQFSLPVIHGI